MPKSSPINRLTASQRRRSVAKQRRLRLAVKRFAQLNLVMLSALQSGAVQLSPTLPRTNEPDRDASSLARVEPSFASTLIVLTLVWLAATVTNVLAGQPITDSVKNAVPDENIDPAGHPRKIHTVWIPIDKERNPVGDIVYLSDALFQDLHRRDAMASGEPSGWMLTKAIYRGTISRGAVPKRLQLDGLTTVIDLTVFQPNTHVRIPFHSDDTQWVPVESKLDGRPIKLNWLDDQPAFTFLVHEPGPYRLSLSLRQVSGVEQAAPGFELAIPEIPSSRVELTVPPDVTDIRLPTARGQTWWDQERRTMIAHLGPARRLVVGWPAADESKSLAAEIDVAELFWLHVRPGTVVLDAKFKVNVMKGRVRQLRLNADPRWRLLPFADESPVERASIIAENPRQIVLQLKRAIDEQEEIDIRLLLTGTSGIGNLRFPLLKLQAQHTSRRLFAVSVDPALDFQEQFEVKLAALAVPDFALQWGDALAKPLFAYELPQQHPMWSLATRPREARNSADQSLTVSLGRGTAELRFAADVKTQNGYQFQYRMSVPEQLVVEKLSVTEDGVQRMAHWSRVGHGVITIFLTDALADRAHVSLSGHLPIPNQGQISLPLINLQTTRYGDSRIQIYRQPEVQVHVANSVGLAPIEDPPRGPSGLDRLVESYAVTERPAAATLIISPNEPTISGMSLTTVRRTEAGWMVEFDCLLRAENGRLDDFQLDIPSSWDGPHSVDLGKDQQGTLTRVDSPDPNRMRLVIRPSQAVAGETHFVVRAPVTTLEGQRMRVPNVLLPGADTFQRYLMLPARDYGQPIEWETPGLESAELPGDFRKDNREIKGFKVLQVMGDDFRATPRIVPQITDSSQVRLADIEVVMSRQRHSLHGVATFDLLPAGLADCVLQLPHGCRLTHVGIDAATASLERLDDSRWRIILRSRHLPQRIEVVFSSDVPHRSRWTLLRDWKAPKLLADVDRDLPVQQTLWTVHGNVSDRIEQLEQQPIRTVHHLTQEMLRLRNTQSLLNLPPEIADQLPTYEVKGWYHTWARRFWSGVNRVSHEASNEASPSPHGRQARSDVQSLERQQSMLAQRLGTVDLLEQARLESFEIIETQQLVPWTIGRDTPVVRCLFPGPLPVIRLYDLRRFSSDVQRWISLVLILAMGCCLIFATRRPQHNHVLRRWPHVFGFALGLIWWLWLSPSLLGWAMIAWSLLSALRITWQTERKSEIGERRARNETSGQRRA